MHTVSIGTEGGAVWFQEGDGCRELVLGVVPGLKPGLGRLRRLVLKDGDHVFQDVHEVPSPRFSAG